ncbi:hypothetical protein AC249_AIPGENE6301 [Exaiptasia diaphana]|nr:hypothetical protein AC249_AIPGENE6301 [Exaiptasia diaphana]
MHCYSMDMKTIFLCGILLLAVVFPAEARIIEGGCAKCYKEGSDGKCHKIANCEGQQSVKRFQLPWPRKRFPRPCPHCPPIGRR